jgi:AbrB family looped-hinge helix DNA binding protein
MRSNETRITEKGQVTIPVEVRRALGLHPRDRVSFEIDPERGVATLRQVPSVVRSLFGSVRASGGKGDTGVPGESLEQMVADEVMSETV